MVSSWGNMNPFFILLGIGYVSIVASQIQFGGSQSSPNQGGGVRFPLPVQQTHQGHQQNQSPRPRPPGQGNPEPTGCNCLSARSCPSGFGQSRDPCAIENQPNGICCIEQANVVLTRVGFTGQGVAPMQFDSATIANGIKSGQAILTKMKIDQADRLKKGKFLKRGTPERAHAFFFQRTDSAKALHEIAYQIAQASIQIAKTESLTPQQSFVILPKIQQTLQVRSSFTCPSQLTPRCDSRARFRTIDGTCNNLQKPNFGKSETGFGRLTPALYSDGIMAPRSIGIAGKFLPNVRDASNTILIDINRLDNKFTLNLMQWSQFVDHDLTLGPFMDMEGEAISCCENGELVNPQPDGCLPIELPRSDRFFQPRRQRCMNFVRSMLAPNKDCSFGAVEQLNALTHWLDGSMIYGSTEGVKSSIVDERTGFLKVSNGNLPPIDKTIDCEAQNPSSGCFVAGDSRVTEQPALTVMHTIWIREHNRIASILRSFNPRINPTELFEQTRRIVIAQVQHITYKEWLPIIIGQTAIRKFGINTLNSGYRNSYNSNANPAIANEFSTAAFRYGHSLVQGFFLLISESQRSSTKRLRDVFNAPDILMKDPDLVNQFTRGLITQNSQTMDNFVTQDLTNHLFQTPSFDFGLDLMSLNIQRGREHAIGTYNQLRGIFGLSVAKNFIGLQTDIPPFQVTRIQTVYQNVEDIDLFVGGMTEKPLRDAILGPLFSQIIGHQFKQLLDGDRFFYDLQGQPGSFTPDQLQEIRKSSLSKVFCDNTDIIEVQPNSFLVPDGGPNRRTICRQIPGMDLSKFV